MGWKSNDYRCSKCSFVWDTITISEAQDELQVCPKCDTLAGERTIATPRNLMQKAAYHMGKRRAGFKEMEEAATLKETMYDLPVNERKELAKEINNLEKVKT
jgi:NAD-dependent SIR2 family protein deacetylase